MIASRVRQLISRFGDNQFFRFLAVGAGNTIFGYGVYYLCLVIDIAYLTAVVVSTILSIVFNFFTTGAIVFRNAAFGKIFGFFAVYGITLIVNLVLLTGLVESGVSKAWGQALVLPVVVIMSFLLNKYLVFRGKK